MATEAYTAVDYQDNDVGAVIVDSVTGCPLPIPIGTFANVDEAESFLAWCHHNGLDPRKVTDPNNLVMQWTIDTLMVAKVTTVWKED